MFKTELHIHTSPVSKCAKVDAITTAQHFLDKGYKTIVITNHLSPTLFEKVITCDPNDWKAVADCYLSDYRLARQAVEGKMNVLLGIELRVRENINDYLIYGISEEFVYNLGNVMDLKLKEIVPIVHSAGGLIFQAHPFRNAMTVTNPELLDGIEVYNLSFGHDSRNDIACSWAKKFNLLHTIGQDYHKPEYLIGAGILTDTEITSNAELVEVLKSKSFKMTDGSQILTY